MNPCFFGRPGPERSVRETPSLDDLVRSAAFERLLLWTTWSGAQRRTYVFHPTVKPWVPESIRISCGGAQLRGTPRLREFHQIFRYTDQIAR